MKCHKLEFMKSIFTLILFLFSLLTCMAQERDGFVSQEKAYVHFDSNFYFAGDTIWYKAYVVRSDNNRPTDISRILYVELLNEQGYLVERQTLNIEEGGACPGQFAIKEDAWAGFYEVRAYTKWMLNFGEETAFSRVLPVYEKNDSSANYMRRNMPLKMTAGNYTISYPMSKFNLKLYPEGGYLVYGLSARVAFEIENEQTMRLRLKGELLDDGKKLMDVESGINKRGVFEFTPQSGHKYQLRFVLNDKTYTNEIVGIKENGYSARADIGTDSMRVRVLASKDAVADGSYICVSCRGKEIIRKELSNQNNYLSVCVDSLEIGVHDVTVKSSLGDVIMCRKVFVRKDSMAVTGKVKYDKKELKPYGKISLELDLGERMGGESVSLAVTDKKQRSLSYYSGNMMTELLLQSDVRGFVENANWYFEKDDETRRKALDLLMMVQGWRRYEWDKRPIVYEAEKEITVSGQMQDVHNRVWDKKRGRKALFASLFMKNDRVLDEKLGERTYRFRGSMYADSLGRFRIYLPSFQGDAVLQLFGFYSDKLEKGKYSNLLHDPKILIKLDSPYMKTQKRYSWYELNEPLVDDKDEIVDEQSIILDNVTVKARKIKTKGITMSPVAEYEFNDFLNEYWDNAEFDDWYKFDNLKYSLVNFESYIEGEIFGKAFVSSPSYVMPMIDDKYDLPAIKGWYGLSEYEFINRIKSVSIVTDLPKRPAYYMLNYPVITINTNGMNSSLSTTGRILGYVYFKKFPEKEERFVEGRYSYIKGFNRPAEYYSPDYSKMPLPAVPDHRHTLYWNPNVTTDKDGKARIEFFNNSSCTEMFISAEGLSEDGKVIVY